MPVITIRTGQSGSTLAKVIGTREQKGELHYEVLTRAGSGYSSTPRWIEEIEILGSPPWPNDPDLRQELHAITKETPLNDQLPRIENVSKRLPHPITWVDDRTIPNVQRCNCFQYMLGLTTSPLVNRVAASYMNVFPGSDFMDFLITEEHLPRTNDLTNAWVVYFVQGRAKHIGKMLPACRVHSKWGTGWVFQHDMFTVPSTYGSTIKFYTPLSPGTEEDLFREFARRCNVREDILAD